MPWHDDAPRGAWEGQAVNKRFARPGAIGLRILAVALHDVGRIGRGRDPGVSAQDDESGLDDNTFTGPNFGWSVEWDEDVWAFEAEDNSGGSDFFSLDDRRG